ncbi:26S proteasome complex subunit DSS1 [Paramuricea clavata]|uniref:26S proteasome complex subunit SEM1 n=1 Tax=Paramuricea clavata TaxID=317549 RepID=A0A6S7KBL8_PARCT|nr:26S proteasome complex subunit DSS1 [Paramuricea clavata]
MTASHSKMAAEKNEKKADLGLLEEDDEFEEFPTEAWTGEEEDQDENHIWQDDWDDDTVEDDFSNQLRYVNIQNWNEK